MYFINNLSLTPIFRSTPFRAVSNLVCGLVCRLMSDDSLLCVLCAGLRIRGCSSRLLILPGVIYLYISLSVGLLYKSVSPFCMSGLGKKFSLGMHVRK
jgi:hypothetical protein